MSKQCRRFLFNFTFFNGKHIYVCVMLLSFVECAIPMQNHHETFFEFLTVRYCIFVYYRRVIVVTWMRLCINLLIWLYDEVVLSNWQPLILLPWFCYVVWIWSLTHTAYFCSCWPLICGGECSTIKRLEWLRKWFCVVVVWDTSILLE